MYLSPPLDDFEELPEAPKDLYDRIADPVNLIQAHLKARKGKKHYKCVRVFEAQTDYGFDFCHILQKEEYEIGSYTSSVLKDRNKERTLLKLQYADRVIQTAIMQKLEPLFLREFHPNSCSSIKKRGIDKAFNLTKEFVKTHTHALKLDVKKYFDSIDHEILKSKLLTIPEIANSPRTIELLWHIIDSTNFASLEHLEYGKSVPIGSYLSQYFANFYLTSLDWDIAFRGFSFVRYMDDYVIFGNPRELCDLKYYLRDSGLPELGLSMKENYQVFNLPKEGLDFVGYRFFRNYQKIRKSTAKYARKRINSRNAASYYGLALRSRSWGFIRAYLPSKFHTSKAA